MPLPMMQLTTSAAIAQRPIERAKPTRAPKKRGLLAVTGLLVCNFVISTKAESFGVLGASILGVPYNAESSVVNRVTWIELVSIGQASLNHDSAYFFSQAWNDESPLGAVGAWLLRENGISSDKSYRVGLFTGMFLCFYKIVHIATKSDEWIDGLSDRERWRRTIIFDREIESADQCVIRDSTDCKAVVSIITHPRAIGQYQSITGRTSGLLGSLGCPFGGAPQKYIHNQQTDGPGCDAYSSRSFPKWSVLFARIGVVLLAWGWWNLRDNQRPLFSLCAFWSGCTLWMYGFAGILIWSAS